MPPKEEHWNNAPCNPSECSPYPLEDPSTLLPPPTPSAASSSGRATFVTALIIAGAALAFAVLCLSLFLFVRRRRQQRRRREALLEAALAATPDPDVELEEGEVVHHAWHIRTVGLDEAAIESIALTRYRASGASDCAVCLGEFADGELLRLLPRCAHAFHVRCIDTWLRAHVNCPLCRCHVLNPAPAAAVLSADSAPPGTVADTGQAATSNITTGHGRLDQHASEQRLQIDEPDGRTTSPSSAEEAAPQEADEQAAGEK